jgi:hypothetical protein
MGLLQITIPALAATAPGTGRDRGRWRGCAALPGYSTPAISAGGIRVATLFGRFVVPVIFAVVTVVVISVAHLPGYFIQYHADDVSPDPLQRVER